MLVFKKINPKFLLLALIISLQSFSALTLANEIETILDNPNVEVREEALVESKSSHTPEKLSFAVKDYTYTINYTPANVELRADYESLSAEEQSQFQATREMFLKKVISMFHFSRLGIGLGIVTKSSVKQVVSNVFPSREELPPEGELRDIVIRLRDEEREKTRLAELELEKQYAGLQGSDKAKAMGSAFTQDLILGLDNILFQQAKLVANSNEFGASLTVGPTLSAGLKKKTFGGMMGVVINLGFDKNSKTLVFEVQRLSETLKEAFTPMGIAGLDLRMGMYFRNNSDRGNLHGYSFFPPAIPTGMSVYNSYFTAGMASGLAFPPIVTDLYSFQSDSNRSTLFRITFSPLMKGFFRFQMGPLPDRIKVVFYKIQDLAIRIKSIMPRLGAGLCRGVLIQ